MRQEKKYFVQDYFLKKSVMKKKIRTVIENLKIEINFYFVFL